MIKEKMIEAFTEVAKEKANEHRESKPTIDYREQTFTIDEIIEVINETEIERKKGKWEHELWFITCSVCGYESADTDDEGDKIATNFCPNCGADMRGEE